MKVGILTFHRAHNYGAVLQCYALQEILKGMGHEVEVIDYRQPWIEEFYKPFSIEVLKKRYKGLKNILRYFYLYKSRYKKYKIGLPIFSYFRNHYFSLSCECKNEIPKNYDAYVIGSDQLWSLSCIGDKKDLVYTANFEHDKNSLVIGYAISTNKHSLPILLNMGLDKDIQNFTSLSLREDFAVDLLKSGYEEKIEQCLDPTVLSKFELWDKMTRESKWKDRHYVLVYQVRNYNDSKNYILSQAKQFANAISNQCEVIDIGTVNPSVQDFVALFRYAKYVITSSFHATAFSLVFNTPFYAVKLNDGKDDRYVNLLNKLNASSRLIENGENVSMTEFDFEETNKHLEGYRTKSLAFLYKSLRKK